LRVLVTGAAGFIGGHVVRALTAGGAEVRAFDRTRASDDDAGVEWVNGDVLDGEAVRRAVADCDAICHLAAVYSYRRADAEPMRLVNIEGSRNVLDAAARGPRRRVVYTSSCTTCGPVPGRPADERDAPRPQELRVPYKRTKVESERLALAAAAEGMDVVVVNPTTPVGPGDERPTPTGKMIGDVASGRIRGYLVGAGLNVVAVEDVAAGHALALERGRAGERYILGGEDMTLREAMATVARAAGRRPPPIPAPWPVVLAAGYASEGLSRMLRREPDLVVLDEIRLARVPMYYSPAKAQRELGYGFRPGRQALEEATAAVLRSAAGPGPGNPGSGSRSAS
jgi:dihydroflavonol-4-reductase